MEFISIIISAIIGATIAWLVVKIKLQNNYMQLDTIGKAGRIIKQADFRLPVVLRNKRWTIKMEAPLRSEKPNRD